MILDHNNIIINKKTGIGWHDYQFGLRWLFEYNASSQLNVVNTNSKIK